VYAVCGALALMLAPASASAQLWFEARLGGGLLAAHYEYESEVLDDTSAGVARYASGPLAVALDVDGIAGFGLTREVGVGVLARVEFAPYLEDVTVGNSTIDDHALVGVGPALAVRTGRSFELGASLEYVGAKFVGSTIEPAGSEVLGHFTFERVSGVGAGIWLGCCAAPGFGVIGFGRAARLTGEHTTFVPVSFGIQATYSTW